MPKKLLLQCNFKRGRHKFLSLTEMLACASIFISFYLVFLSSRLSVRLGASIGRLPPSENKDPTQLLGYGTEGGETRTDGFFFSLPLLLLSVSLKRGGESLLATLTGCCHL